MTMVSHDGRDRSPNPLVMNGGPLSSPALGEVECGFRSPDAVSNAGLGGGRPTATASPGTGRTAHGFPPDIRPDGGRSRLTMTNCTIHDHRCKSLICHEYPISKQANRLHRTGIGRPDPGSPTARKVSASIGTNVQRLPLSSRTQHPNENVDEGCEHGP